MVIFRRQWEDEGMIGRGRGYRGMGERKCESPGYGKMDR
jgi:hypothetical protein